MNQQQKIDKLAEALRDLVAVLSRDLDGLKLIQPELRQAEQALGCLDIVDAEVVTWNGEGLPPVGTVCEYRCGYVEQPYEFSQCTVIAHFDGESGKRLAAFTYVGHDGVVQLGRGAPSLFRPIRTPEQIAADEREKVISQIAIDALRGSGELINKEWCANLHDSGWRKVQP